MLGRHKVKLEIDTDGSTTVSVEGVKGTSCKTLTADLEHKLGGKVIETTPTREMKETDKNVHHISN